MNTKYPSTVRCYLVESRNGLPPHPLDEPVESRLVHNEDDREKTIAELRAKYPGGWIVWTPTD